MVFKLKPVIAVSLWKASPILELPKIDVQKNHYTWLLGIHICFNLNAWKMGMPSEIVIFAIENLTCYIKKKKNLGVMWNVNALLQKYWHMLWCFTVASEPFTESISGNGCSSGLRWSPWLFTSSILRRKFFTVQRLWNQDIVYSIRHYLCSIYGFPNSKKVKLVYFKIDESLNTKIVISKFLCLK